MISAATIEQEGSSEDNEFTKYKLIIENKKMFFILSLATLYCVLAAIVIGYFVFNPEKFTGLSGDSESKCFYKSSSD